MSRTDETVAYYTECWSARLAHGHNAGSRAIHYGLDFDATEGADAAKLRTNAHVVERLGLVGTAPLQILDLGCGVGGTIVDLAGARRQWQWLGVDATPANLALARAHASAAGIAERTRFVAVDFESELPPERVDGAYALESFCHACERAATSHALRRRLAPGAPFVVVDFFRTGSPLDARAAERYGALRRGFAIADYYDEPLERVLARAGFAVVTSVDLTARVVASVAASATRAKEAFGGAPSSVRRVHHLEACVAAAELLASGHLAYRSLRAT